MRRIALIAALVLFASSCGGSDDGASCGFEAALITDTLQVTADAMAGISSANFDMTRTGAEVEVQGMVFDSAIGQYGAPSSARALLRVDAAGVSVELGTISIEDRTWLTNPITGGWEELTRGTGFNPAVVFDTATGWKPLIESLGDPRYSDAAQGCESMVLLGEIEPARITSLTLGLVESQEVDLELWVDPGTHLVSRAAFSTSGGAGISDWLIQLSGFNAPADIAPPG
ncbi:LppX_LprAFG lipoprotein [bacterium]|nr:LppX_LprAFG lipoprotein [bacterium]